MGNNKTTLISDERIKHMHGVAEFMYENYDKFNCKYINKEEIYILGLNHDIGYINGKSNHELCGANMFAEFTEFGQKNIMTQCILYHGDTPREYMEKYQCSEEDIPDELILLWLADMCIESAGENAGKNIGFQARLDNLAERYGTDSEPYLICKETMDWLNKTGKAK